MLNSNTFRPTAEMEEDKGGEWITTYADMVTLLLTFFVMLLSMSSLDAKRFDQVMNSIQVTLGSEITPGGRMGLLDMHQVKKKSLSTPTGDENEPLLKDIRQTLDEKNLDDVIQVMEQDGKIILRVKGKILFQSGATKVASAAKPVLNEIARLIRAYPDYKMDVGGHTDSRPSRGKKYDSNWELSALRATSVLRYLVSRGVSPRRLTATGFADTDPLAPNTSAKNMAINRRVEFVLEQR